MKNGWKMVKLGEVLKQDKASAVSVEPSQSYEMVGVYSFGRGLFHKESQLGLNTSYKVFYRLKENHVVMSQLFGWEGALALSSKEFEGKFVSNQFPTFLVDETKADRDFIGFFLKRKKVWEMLFERGTGMGSRRRMLNPESLLGLEIPLPPLTEQRRIAERLAALKEKIDAVRALRGEQVREVERVEGNFSKAIFENALIEHQTVRLSEIAHLITKGSSPNWQGINYVENEGVLFITSENVRRYKIRLEPKKFVETRFNEIEKKSILKRDDILMNIVGASIGRTAIYDRDDVANINQAVCLIRLDKTKIDLEYALHFFNSPVCVGYMFDKQVDAARANLSMGNISNFLIPLPDFSEQRRIVAEIQAFHTKMEQLKAAQAEQLAELEGLFPAVLERAFRGEW